MINVNSTDPFIASWTANNSSLNPYSNGTLLALVEKIKNFIFYIPNSIIAACINPRPESPFFPSKPSNVNYGSFNKEIITPDRVHLAASVHIQEGATSRTPTVILFNPLGTNDTVHRGLKNRLMAKCNVVTFDYRGLGTTWRAKDLVVDGDSVYQYVVQELGIQTQNVHFYGFSLGGAIAAQVKARILNAKVNTWQIGHSDLYLALFQKIAA